jgi:hypothetical protein
LLQVYKSFQINDFSTTFDTGIVSGGEWWFPPRAGVTQLVECDLAKVDVAGSNPVSRSIVFLLEQSSNGPFFSVCELLI